MPIYEYLCTSCGHAFEARRAIAQESPSCPACGALPKRRISTFAAAVSDGSPVAGGCACGGACGCSN